MYVHKYNATIFPWICVIITTIAGHKYNYFHADYQKYNSNFLPLYKYISTMLLISLEFVSKVQLFTDICTAISMLAEIQLQLLIQDASFSYICILEQP